MMNSDEQTLTPTPPQEPRRALWRRILLPRFSLRTFILVTTILTAIISIWVRNSLRQKQVIEELRALPRRYLNVMACYDNGAVAGDDKASLQRDSYMRYSVAKLLGADFVHNLRSIHFSRNNGFTPTQLVEDLKELHPSDLESFGAALDKLKEFPSIEHLSFENASFLTDQNIALIKKFKNLKGIMVHDYQANHDYSSLAKLSEMKSLYGIDLWLNNLTAEDIEACKELAGLTWFGIQSYDISVNGLPPRIDPAVFRTIAKQFPKLETLSIIHYDNLNEDDLASLNQHPALKKILLQSLRGTGKPSKLNMKAIRASLPKIQIQEG